MTRLILRFFLLFLFFFPRNSEYFQIQWIFATRRPRSSSFKIRPVQTHRIKWCGTIQTLRSSITPKLKGNTRCEPTFDIVHIIAESGNYRWIQRRFQHRYVSGKNSHFCFVSNTFQRESRKCARQHTHIFCANLSICCSRNQKPVSQTNIGCFPFQIGRSSESPIDFVVMDTLPGDKKDVKVMQSTISRFACRILVKRNEQTEARIYAAGFDSSRNIFLGVSGATVSPDTLNPIISTSISFGSMRSVGKGNQMAR